MKYTKAPIRRCAKCGTDLHNIIITTGQTFYCKVTGKVYCSKECLGRCKNKKISSQYPHSEVIAKQYLWDLGLKPSKCRVVGYPDFKCCNNIWVEVKTPQTGLNKNQIKKFKELLMKGEQIFILYVNRKDTSFFELKLGRI